MKHFIKNKKFVIASTFLAAILFSIRFLIFFLPHTIQQYFSDGTLPGFFLAVAEHLFIVPVLWFLPAPRWSKILGTLWVINDIITDILAITGNPPAVYLEERYLGHLFLAAPWFFAVGNYTKEKKLRWFAWVTGFFLAFYTIVFMLFHASGVILIPVAFSLPLWLLFVGLRLKNTKSVKKEPTT